MDCFDTSLALNALIGASLVVAGSNLMVTDDRVSRSYGAYCFAFGYFILGLAAAGRDIHNMGAGGRRFVMGLSSVIAIVAGTFMMYYHVQDAVKKALEGRVNNDTIREDIVKSIPVIDHVLIYGGFLGLILTIAMDNRGNINYVKGGLGLGAVAVMSYTKTKLVESMASGKDVDKHNVAHILSWGLLVLAIAYAC